MGKRKKRKVDIVVLSDIHLGTYGCHAVELLRYLKTIKPGRVILNGDIIDMWQFNKRFWPKSHMQVIRHITGLLTRGVKVVYLTGNHDEMLRRFAGFKLGALQVDNKIVLRLNKKKAWVFHGDVFDVTMRYSKWLAKLGAFGYDLLIVINAFVNWVLNRLGREKLSLSKRVKDSVKAAVKFINKFEQTAADIAISKGYDYVVCGHIHQPEIRTIKTPRGSVVYMNSGDWIENLSALEYDSGVWRIYRYAEDTYAQSMKVPKRLKDDMDSSALFKDLVTQFLDPGK